MRPCPQRLDFLWAPHKLVFRIVVQKGKLDEFPALFLIEHGEHKVVEDAVFNKWKLSVDESFCQEEADQRGLVVKVTQGSQALQYAGDAQVVMRATAKQHLKKKKRKRYLKEFVTFGECFLKMYRPLTC